MTPDALTPKQERANKAIAARHWFLFFVMFVYPRYQPNPVAQLVTAELEQFMKDVEAGLSPRLIIELPPRVGKSELVSRRFPPWVLGHHPDWNLGIISYGAELAEKLSRSARQTVMSPAFAEVFRSYQTELLDDDDTPELDKTAKSVSHWALAPTKETPEPGGVMATGINGPVTGSGFHILILDDPHKNWEEAQSVKKKQAVWEYYGGTLYDRLEPGGGIIVVQQRWAVDDLSGRLKAPVEDVDADGFDVEYVDKWRVVSLPAQAEAGRDDALGRQVGEWLPGRYSVAQWEKAKANNLRRNPRIWWAKFQQRPAPPEGAIFQPYEWIRFEDDCEENEGPVFIFGDTSYGKNKSTSDFSCFGVWRFERKPETFRLLDVYRKRVAFPQLKQDLIDLCVEYGLFVQSISQPWQGQRRVFIEDYGSGTSLIQELMNSVQHPTYGRIRIPVEAWRPRRDQNKDARAHAVTPYMADGKVAFPKTAPWLPHLIQTMTEFQGEGSVEFDDEIDMVSMSIIRMGVQQPAARAGVKYHHLQIVA